MPEIVDAKALTGVGPACAAYLMPSDPVGQSSTAEIAMGQSVIRPGVESTGRDGGLGLDITIQFRPDNLPPLLMNWKLARSKSPCKIFDGQTCFKGTANKIPGFGCVRGRVQLNVMGVFLEIREGIIR